MPNLGLFILALLLGQQPAPSTVDGVVVRAGTSEPIARAVVQLSGDGLSAPAAMMTDADGRFGFQAIPPGRYQLTASRNGYRDSAYGQRGPNGKGIALVLEAGKAHRDIRLEMTAYGAISGRVYDTYGEPMANVPVVALRYSYLDGQRTLTPLKTDQTNDRGEYRLFWLSPGEYYIQATPNGATEFTIMMSPDDAGTTRVFRFDRHGMPLGDASGSPAEKLGEADVPVYYPGTADVRTAARIELRSGADIGGVDFALNRVKTRKVSGTITDSITGQPATSASVFLIPRSPSPTGRLNGRQSGGGKFEIQDVLPGSYDLVSTYRLRVDDNGAVRIMGGRIPVEVGGADVEGLALVLSPSVDIAGEVVTEGSSAGIAGDRHPIVGLKEELGGIPGRPGNIFAQFSTAGQFVINDLIAGNYQVVVSDLPPGTYVKSIRFGPIDALNGRVHIDSRTTDRIQIVLSTNAGALEGSVVSENREPLANVPVALVPDATRRHRADLYRSARTDESGLFRLEAIPPGDYSVFAWEDIEDGLWRDPEFIQRNEAAGRTVRVTEGGRDTIEVPATRSPF